MSRAEKIQLSSSEFRQDSDRQGADSSADAKEFSIIFQTVLKAALLAAFAGLLSACDSSATLNSRFVQEPEFHVYKVGPTRVGEFTATLDTGGMIVSDAEFYIVNPSNGQDLLGHFSLHNDLFGHGTVMTLKIDIQKMKAAQAASDPYLPNGSPIPVAGLNPRLLQTFPIGGTSSRIYASFDGSNETAMMGVALTVQNFKLNKATDLFYSFSEADLRGVVGIYGGAGLSQSGLALFVDASTFLREPVSREPGDVEFIPRISSIHDYIDVQHMLYQFHKNRERLKIL